jgi:hypothetical protein
MLEGIATGECLMDANYRKAWFSRTPERHAQAKMGEVAVCNALARPVNFSIGEPDGGIDVEFKMNGHIHTADVKTMPEHSTHFALSKTAVRGLKAEYLVACRVGFLKMPNTVEILGFISAKRFKSKCSRADVVRKSVPPGMFFVEKSELTPFPALILGARSCAVCGNHEAYYSPDFGKTWFCKNHRPGE